MDVMWSNVDVFWMLCGPLWKNVDVLWMLCGRLWRNVVVMWKIVEECGYFVEECGCFVDVMWDIVEECGCCVEKCGCNVDPPHLHISRFDQVLSPPWSVILKYAIVDVMWTFHISTIHSFLSFTFKHFT